MQTAGEELEKKPRIKAGTYGIRFIQNRVF